MRRHAVERAESISVARGLMVGALLSAPLWAFGAALAVSWFRC